MEGANQARLQPFRLRSPTLRFGKTAEVWLTARRRAPPNLKKGHMKQNQRKKIVPIVLTNRDKAIILSVYENRFLQRDQIQRIFFPDVSIPACNMRLKKLYEHRFLDRLIRPVVVGSNQIVYALHQRGADIVSAVLNIERQGVNWKRDHNRVEFLFMDHTLSVSEFKINLDLALAEEYSTELLFYSRESKGLMARLPDPDRKKKHLIVNPDAFFGLKTEAGNSYFFLEIDMGTESLKRFAEKVTAYKKYWKTGKYHKDYEFNHFRVLTVAESKKRLSNLIKVTGNAGGNNMFVFALMTDIQNKNLLSQIWLSPASSLKIALLKI